MALPLRRIGIAAITTNIAPFTSQVQRHLLCSGRPSISNTITTTTTTTVHTRTSRSHPCRAMATTALEPRQYEWLVVVPDFPNSLAKRLEARPQHFAGLKPFIDSGRYQMGGAILDEVPIDDEPSSLKMSGSTLVIVASSKEEVLQTLREDVYAKSGVWDVDKTQMWPLKCAFRIPVKQ